MSTDQKSLNSQYVDSDTLDVGQIFRVILMQSKLLAFIIFSGLSLGIVSYLTSEKIYKTTSLLQVVDNGSYSGSSITPELLLGSTNTSDLSSIKDLYTSRTNIINIITQNKVNLVTNGLSYNNKKSIDQFMPEDEKSLSNAGIVPRSFVKFLDNWILGRGFAIGSGAMDLRDKDLSVILKYEETTAPTKPKMVNSFVFHVRKLVMRGSGAVDVEM